MNNNTIVNSCPNCKSEISDSVLACPICQTLVHGERLKALRELALQAADEGDNQRALQHWRDIQQLLPPNSKQAIQVSEEISRVADAIPKPKQRSRVFEVLRKQGLILGAIALLIWKFKFVSVFLLTKGKFLLLGLTKSSTLFSMLLSLSVYWLAFGWQFALGLIVSMYVHEMGHVYALNRLGIRASPPMFIPGLGAVVRMSQYPNSATEDSTIGLAGPVWGMGAALSAWLIYSLGGGDIWGAIARVGAWLNLFNLIPVWQLDGRRGFRALTFYGRIAILSLAAVAALVTEEAMLWLIVVVGIFTSRSSPAAVNDTRTLITFSVLLIVLSALTGLQLTGLD